MSSSSLVSDSRFILQFLAMVAGVALILATGGAIQAFTATPKTKVVVKYRVKPTPKMYPLAGGRTAGAVGGTYIVCTDAGRNAKGGPLDPNKAPKPGDVFVKTCVGSKAETGPVG
jgi:hypothetical protein